MDIQLGNDVSGIVEDPERISLAGSIMTNSVSGGGNVVLYWMVRTPHVAYHCTIHSKLGPAFICLRDVAQLQAIP